MSSKLEKHVTRSYVNTEFSIIGLLLIIYALVVLLFPQALYYYFVSTNSQILENEYLFYGLYFIIVVLGTMVPFFIIRINSKIKTRTVFKGASVNFKELFINGLVFFTISTALVFITNVVAAYFGQSGRLVSSIGFELEGSNLNNVLYAFMFILGAPLIEEYAFRGVLLNALKKYGKRFALLASSLIFALAHGSFLEMIPSFVMGIMLSKFALRYRSMQPSLLIHIIFNLLIYLFCIMPSDITMYIAYALALIYIISIVLVLTRKYKRTVIADSPSNKYVASIFFSNAAIIIAMLMMIIASTLMLIF